MTEVYRGFTITYTPPPERVWSFRPWPDAPLESHRSAFQARRAIDVLIDGLATSSTPRRDSAATSLPRKAPPPGKPPAPSPSVVQGPPTGEIARLLGAEAEREIAVTLPSSGRRVTVRGYRRRETRFAGTLPANFRTVPNKVAVDLDGVAVYPEFAIVRRLEAAGWEAAWRKNWQGAAFWADIGTLAHVPDPVLAVFDSVAKTAGAGAWDILAWKDGRVLFIESKQSGSDKLTLNQLRWLETALDAGIPIESFAVYEYQV